MFYRTDANGNAHKDGKPFFWNVITANTTLTKDNHDQVIAIGTDALTVTLPAVGVYTAPAGTVFHFLNIGADGNNIITISPNADDAIFGTIANSAADSVASGADDKDFVNTKATANKGDRVTLISDGSTGWYIVGGVGIWASES